MKNRVLQEDIENIASCDILDELDSDSVILVTGATGLLGSLVVKSLLRWKRKQDKKIKVIAMVRSLDKAKKIFANEWIDADLSMYVGDVNRPLDIEGKVDYIIHGASATSSRYFVENPVETIYTALDGTRNVLELARDKEVKKAVYLSSLEVYGTPDKKGGYIKEDEYGYIDPTQVRSSYSEGKRMAECVCVSYAKEYGVPVTVARLSQTFGAGVDYNDGRVFAEFARCAIEKRDIVLHTQGNTVRTYCYTSDAIKAIFMLMLHGKAGESYNVTNMETAVSIREMAELVCGLDVTKCIQVVIDIPKDIAAYGYNPEMVICLDSGKLQKLGWKPEVCMREMFERLIESMEISSGVGKTI